MSEGRLRLTVLGGFLGSGKTTWLRHQLHTGSFGRVHVIVNEAAEAPVDDALLGRADQITVLAGACVCCDGRNGLVRALLDICDARSRDGNDQTRLEHIVLETSGLADPGAILTLLQGNPILARQIVVAETVVIVDALNGAAQLQHEALSRKQIEAADGLILTKTDRANPLDTMRLRATLADIAPGAVQSAAVFGSAMALGPLDPGTEPHALSDHDEGGVPIHACQLDLGVTPDWTAFTVWLSSLLYARGDQIVRVKGVVQTPAGRLLVQTVRRSVQSPEILPDMAQPVATDNVIAVIGRGFTQDQLRASFRQFSA